MDKKVYVAASEFAKTAKHPLGSDAPAVARGKLYILAACVFSILALKKWSWPNGRCSPGNIEPRNHGETPRFSLLKIW